MIQPSFNIPRLLSSMLNGGFNCVNGGSIVPSSGPSLQLVHFSDPVKSAIAIVINM